MAGQKKHNQLCHGSPLVVGTDQVIKGAALPNKPVRHVGLAKCARPEIASSQTTVRTNESSGGRDREVTSGVASDRRCLEGVRLDQRQRLPATRRRCIAHPF
jgi:hypothetical protein